MAWPAHAAQALEENQSVDRFLSPFILPYPPVYNHAFAPTEMAVLLKKCALSSDEQCRVWRASSECSLGPAPGQGRLGWGLYSAM